MNSRNNICKLIERAEEGTISWEDIARKALSYMSESDVSDMTTFADLFKEEEEEEEKPCKGDYIIESTVSGPDIIYKHNCRWNYEKWSYQIKENDSIYDIIKNEMEKEKFWPNVWALSDHGNYNLISLDSLKEE